MGKMNTSAVTNDNQDGHTTRREFLKDAAVLGASLMAGGLLGGATRAAAADVKTGYFTTKDGVKLHYLESGRGPALVMIPGWSQTAAMYVDQLQGLSERYRVIALDMRGHGESDKPDRGYRIARLAGDVHEFLHGMDLDHVAIAGHSMGCSVIWSYWDNFGRDRISRMILIDQAPTATAWPGWSEDEIAETGASFTPKSLYETAAALAGPEGVKTTEGMIKGGFFTKAFPKDRLEWVLQENLKFPRAGAARLLVDHCGQDWRDTIRTIDVPTVGFSGRVSFFTPRSQEWIARQIPGAKVHIFEEAEGGSHFMFMENPKKFNRLVAEFLG